MNQNYGQLIQQIYGNPINYNYPSQEVNTAKYVVFAILGIVAIIAIVIIAIFAKNNNSSYSDGRYNNSSITQSIGSKSAYKVSLKFFRSMYLIIWFMKNVVGF